MYDAYGRAGYLGTFYGSGSATEPSFGLYDYKFNSTDSDTYSLYLHYFVNGNKHIAVQNYKNNIGDQYIDLTNLQNAYDISHNNLMGYLRMYKENVSITSGKCELSYTFDFPNYKVIAINCISIYQYTDKLSIAGWWIANNTNTFKIDIINTYSAAITTTIDMYLVGIRQEFYWES